MDEYFFETEYAIIDISLKKEESLTLTDGYQIVQVLDARRGSMTDSDTWFLTVLIEREMEIESDE